jgi:hypothetical protein
MTRKRPKRPDGSSALTTPRGARPQLPASRTEGETDEGDEGDAGDLPRTGTRPRAGAMDEEELLSG